MMSQKIVTAVDTDWPDLSVFNISPFILVMTQVVGEMVRTPDI